MERNSIKRAEIEGYLFGELSQKELEILESLILNSDDFFEQLLDAEQCLMDEYLFDENISSERRKKMGKLFNSSQEYTEKLNFTKVLRQVVAETSSDNLLQLVEEEAKVSSLKRVWKILRSFQDIRYEVVSRHPFNTLHF